MRSGLLQPQQDWTPACYLPSHQKEDEDAEAPRNLTTRSIDRTRTHAFARMLAQMINLARVCAELGAIFASLPSPRDHVHAVCLRLVCTQLFGPVSTNREINLERHTFNPRLDFQSQKVAARPLREQRPARLG